MLKLAPVPNLDLALLMLQGEIFERLEALIASGSMDIEEIEQLTARADEYVVMIDSRRIVVCLDTRLKIEDTYQRCRQAVGQYKQSIRLLGLELENARDL